MLIKAGMPAHAYLDVISLIWVNIWQHQLACVLKKKYHCIYIGQMTCYLWRTLLMACKNNWMALPSSVLNIWWYWMKWRRKFLYLEKNNDLSDVNDIYFNGETNHRSQKYKYLGNFISETQTIRGDIFRQTYEYLCNKATNALFSINKKVSYHQK